MNETQGLREATFEVTSDIPKDPIVKLGHPALEAVCQPIPQDNPFSALEVVAELTRALRGARGLGLAANQIGRTERVFVMDVRSPHIRRGLAPDREGLSPLSFVKPGEFLAIINPVIWQTGGKYATHKEACLSIPGVTLDVVRPDVVTITYDTLYPVVHDEYEIRHCKTTFYGYAAKCIQHEIDHLNGMNILDRGLPKQVKKAKRMLKAKGYNL